MKVKNLFGERQKERPADTHLESHALMVRGGYIKQVSNGIYSMYTPMVRISQKIETILREEMERVGSQEVKFPVVMPADLWRRSGRYGSILQELVRFQDRNDHDMVLGMTHEEAAVHISEQVASSYTQYPYSIYQIQTKFRDELRSRGGLIRVREFTMKDAYSFHIDQQELEEHYMEYHEAYERIFRRVGVPEVISVQADSGMMGGDISHEFMLLSDVGEDSIAICTNCDFRSNLEVADAIVKSEKTEQEAIQLVETPDVTTIEDVQNFFELPLSRLCKAVIYQKHSDDTYIVAFLRGDLDISEIKLGNAVGDEVYPAPDIPESTGIVPGYIGPHELALQEGTIVLFDDSLRDTNNLVCGGNKEGYHYQGFSLERDASKDHFDGTFYNLANTFEGAICPECGEETISIRRGIEVGNIFQLGDRYTRSMGMQYADQNDELQYPLMCSYGIGVGRLAASICEERRDEYGPIWPITIAPWQVQICALRVDNEEVKETADALYDALRKSGVEVLYDDRDVRAGSMFSDADLFGVPVRVVVSPRNCKEGVVEITTRDKTFEKSVAIDEASDFIKSFVNELLAEYSAD